MQIDHLILTKNKNKTNLVLFNKRKKRTYHLVNFPIPKDHRVKIKENGKIDKYLNLARELKNTVEQEVDSGNNCSWYTLEWFQ